jgi:alkylation response protein AidB-like acyl-CoA dehydrogenase
VIYNPAREAAAAGEEEKVLFRFAGSLVKLFTARQAVSGASEALEAFGGAGYMEDTGMRGSCVTPRC